MILWVYAIWKFFQRSNVGITRQGSRETTLMDEAAKRCRLTSHETKANGCPEIDDERSCQEASSILLLYVVIVTIAKRRAPLGHSGRRLLKRLGPRLLSAKRQPSGSANASTRSLQRRKTKCTFARLCPSIIELVTSQVSPALPHLPEHLFMGHRVIIWDYERIAS